METKERIIKAAHELFFKYGIKSITMDDIAKHLAISKKTIYHFFEDKDQIVISLARVNIDRHEKYLDQMSKESKDAVDHHLKITQYIGHIFSEMTPTLFYDMQKYHPKAWQQFKEFREKVIVDIVKNNMEKGVEEGLYRKDINPKIMAKLRTEEMEMGMNPVVFSPNEFTLIEVQVALIDHFLHGILTLKGHKLVNKYKQIHEEEH